MGWLPLRHPGQHAPSPAAPWGLRGAAGAPSPAGCCLALVPLGSCSLALFRGGLWGKNGLGARAGVVLALIVVVVWWSRDAAGREGPL